MFLAGNWKKKLSDEASSCTREYANKIKLCEPELRYISKVLERKPIFALAIPCSLLLEWYRSLSEKSSQLVDYLLEAAVKGHVFSFTDDKAKRHEMNKSRWDIEEQKLVGYRGILGKQEKQRCTPKQACQ